MNLFSPNLTPATQAERSDVQPACWRLCLRLLSGELLTELVATMCSVSGTDDASGSLQEVLAKYNHPIFFSGTLHNEVVC